MLVDNRARPAAAPCTAPSTPLLPAAAAAARKVARQLRAPPRPAPSARNQKKKCTGDSWKGRREAKRKDHLHFAVSVILGLCGRLGKVERRNSELFAHFSIISERQVTHESNPYRMMDNIYR